MSSDSTSRRHLNYQAHHIHLRVPVKNADGSVTLSADPKIRFLGIASTVDHTTATSQAAWLTLYNEIILAYNASPLGMRLGTLDLRMICRVLRGMCGDHANNEKALSEAWRALKHESLLQELGEERLKQLNEQVDELRELKQRWVALKLDEAGGFEAYMQLPPDERAARDLACVHAMTRELGTDALNKLDEADRRLLTVWIWTGCGRSWGSRARFPSQTRSQRQPFAVSSTPRMVTSRRLRTTSSEWKMRPLEVRRRLPWPARSSRTRSKSAGRATWLSSSSSPSG